MSKTNKLSTLLGILRESTGRHKKGEEFAVSLTELIDRCERNRKRAREQKVRQFTQREWE